MGCQPTLYLNHALRPQCSRHPLYPPRALSTHLQVGLGSDARPHVRSDMSPQAPERAGKSESREVARRTSWPSQAVRIAPRPRLGASERQGAIMDGTAEAYGPILRATVVGSPAPQGSKTMVSRTLANGQRTSRMIEANPRHRSWRALVTEAIRKEAEAVGWVRLVDVPIRLTLTFTMPVPQATARTMAKSPGLYPAWKAPDLDKLSRSVADSITKAEIVWDDDARVTHLLARKAYQGSARHLSVPGVLIEVREQKP